MTALEFRARLDAVGLSQYAFAGKAGTRPQVVNRWTQATRKVPHWVPSWLDMYEQLSRS